MKKGRPTGDTPNSAAPVAAGVGLLYTHNLLRLTACYG